MSLRELKDPTDRPIAAAPAHSGRDAVPGDRTPPWWARYLWAGVALLAGLGVTLLAQQLQSRQQRVAQRRVQQELAMEGYVALRARMHAAQSLLRAAQALYLGSEDVTDAEFASFYASMRPREQFPDLLALTYAQRETGADGTRYVTRWVQPRAGNDTLAGMVLDRQSGRLGAVLAAREVDQPVLSAPFAVAGSPAAEAGQDIAVTLCLPVYSPGALPGTRVEREARGDGAIAATFRVAGMIENAMPVQTTRAMHLRVSDATAVPAVALYDSHPQLAMPTAQSFVYRLEYGQRVWNVAMQPLPPGSVRPGWWQAMVLAGVLASVLLALLAFSIVGTRQRALELGSRMSRRYRESEERFRALNDLLPALVLLADAGDGRITYVNHVAGERLGPAVREANLHDLFADTALGALLRDPTTQACSRAEVLLGTSAGPCFWANVAISRISLGGRDQWLLVAADISAQRQLTERLSYQASHDALTELYNRREFERQLRATLTVADGVVPSALLLYVDLDQFKLVNDTSGHLAGDQLLVQLAIVMRRQLSAPDVLARLGGDEFGVLVAGVRDRDQAGQIAERVRQCIDGYVFVWEQHSYMVSASIGGVLVDRSGLNLSDLLAQADTACYMAKELGRNRVHFYSAQDDQTVLRRGEMQWANRLRWAIDQQRLVLTCQEVWPLPWIAAGRASGIEVLLRFREESGVLVVPGAFIPAAERYGLMPAIDRWVIETTLAHFDQLHHAGSALDLVSINLSGASISDDALADWIIALLRHHGVTPSRVCFEVTETVAVRNLAQLVHLAQRLRAVGCRIALDDFGAGMSSFTYLKNLPVDIIKIDGSFIRDMLVDPVSHLMVRAVTDIGHRLGLEVVAEWVGDAQTAQALTALGVNYAQGFGLHEPEIALFQR
ncbi:MAG TPA: EAL domain-containing protein [Rhodanobacter sp.]